MNSTNLTFECGSKDFRVWDRSQSDFGQCFFRLGLQFPTLGILAIISAYYIGKKQITTYSELDVEWNRCQSGLIYGRAVIVSLLTVLSLTQLIVRFGIFRHAVSVTEIAIAGVKTGAWLLHLVFILRLKRGSSFNTRGPKPILVAWFCTAVISVLEFRSRYGTSKTWDYSGSREVQGGFPGDLLGRRENFYRIRSGGRETSRGPYHDHDDVLRDDYLWLWSSAVELILQGLYLLTAIPGSIHLEQRHYRQRSRMYDIIYSAYEGEENNSYAGFDADEEELPLGTAKENVGFLSKLLFLWVTPIMKKGACGFLKTTESLFELPYSLSTRNVALLFQKWTITRGLSLLRSLHVSFGLEFYSVGILKLIADAMGNCGPILLNYLVSYIESPEKDGRVWVGYAYVGGLFGAAIVGALANTHFNLRMAEVNIKIRAALITTIYRKTVHLRKTSIEKFNAGEIINFMSTDTDRIVNFCPSFHAFWSLPAQVAITLYLLYLQIGIAFLAGVIFTILLIPINRFLANKIGELSTKMMKSKDQRVKLMSEILYGIRTLKFHSWETYFFEKVNAVRQEEMKSLKARKYLDAMCVYFWATTPVLVSVLSFGTYVLLGNTLTAAKVFTSIALFNMLISPLNALPWVLNGLVEAWVSIKRINCFLKEEETEPINVYKPLPTAMAADHSLVASECIFDWNGTVGTRTKPLNLKVRKGQFIGVIGTVGSGKSSLLSALLGELNQTQGTLSVSDPLEGIGLVQQEAWIQRGTIRSNICFAPNTNLTKYKAVIESCCLKDDLNSFKWKDDTIVGENGTSLSGGQKIRLTLARAVYQDFETYFLDDIFAAVDYKVAKYLYNNCVMGILRNKTRIISTHHTQFLQDADLILVLDQGNIISQGPPSEILEKYGETNSFTEESSDCEASTSSKLSRKRSVAVGSPGAQDPSMTKSSHSFELTNGHGESCELNEEVHHEGTIRLHVFKSYYKAIGPFLFWMIILSLTAMQASRNFSDIWLAYWVSETTNSSNSDNSSTIASWTEPTPTFETSSYDLNSVSGNEPMPLDSEDYYENNMLKLQSFLLVDNFSRKIPFLHALDPTVRYYFSIFIVIGLLNSVFTLARAFLFALGGIMGAIRIHSALLNSILKAKM